jgi:AbrB family looped-hinge helix DNA binding protein
MKITKTDIIRNGIWLTFPPLLFSLILMNRLPAALTPALFNKGIPDVLAIGENIGRILVFALQGKPIMSGLHSSFFINMNSEDATPRPTVLCVKKILTIPVKSYKMDKSKEKEKPMSTATMTSKGQTTIPKDIREGLGLHAKDQIQFTMLPDKTVIFRVKMRAIQDLYGSLHDETREVIPLEKMKAWR